MIALRSGGSIARASGAGARCLRRSTGRTQLGPLAQQQCHFGAGGLVVKITSSTGYLVRSRGAAAWRSRIPGSQPGLSTGAIAWPRGDRWQVADAASKARRLA